MAVISFPPNPEIGDTFEVVLDSSDGSGGTIAGGKSVSYQYYQPLNDTTNLPEGDPYWKIYGEYSPVGVIIDRYVDVPGDEMEPSNEYRTGADGTLYNMTFAGSPAYLDKVEPGAQDKNVSFYAKKQTDFEFVYDDYDAGTPTGVHSGVFDLSTRPQMRLIAEPAYLIFPGQIFGSCLIGDTFNSINNPYVAGGNPEYAAFTHEYQWQYIAWEQQVDPNDVAASDTATAVGLKAQGTGYTAGTTNYNTTAITGLGTGCKVDVSVGVDGKALEVTAITDAGTGYSIGDELQIDGGGNDATIIVTDVMVVGAGEAPPAEGEAGWADIPGEDGQTYVAKKLSQIDGTKTEESYYVRCKYTSKKPGDPDFISYSNSQGLIYNG